MRRSLSSPNDAGNKLTISSVDGIDDFQSCVDSHPASRHAIGSFQSLASDLQRDSGFSLFTRLAPATLTAILLGSIHDVQ
jgi:hypothetical protein